MAYTGIQLLVPLQYAYGVHKTQTDFTANHTFYDQDPRTYGSASSVGDTELTFYSSVTPKWFFLDSDEAIRTSGTGSYTIEYGSTSGAGTTVPITSYHAEVGKSSAWTVSTPNFYRNNTNTETWQSLLIKLNNSTANATWALDVVPTYTTSYTHRKRGIIWSADFTVPLFNRGHRYSESFNVQTSRTRTGNDYSDWRAARNNQVIPIHQFQWTGLTAAQLAVFDRFFAAFNGNIQQPFVMCRLTDGGSNPNYEMQFWRLIIQDESIQIDKTKGSTPTYSLSFTAHEMLINY